MVLNLVYPERSDVRFKIIRFPDGQQDIRIFHPQTLSSSVRIYSRMNSFLDIELIIEASKILRGDGVREVLLYAPYFLGARSDRKFEQGSINYSKHVATPIINSLKFDEVTVMDPHSDVLEACIDNFNKISNGDLVKWALKDLGENYIPISPDAGALKKIHDTLKEVGYDEEIIVASKHREISTGKILSVNVPLTMAHTKKRFVIIDDICDGGWTFLELARSIKKTFPDAEIYLVVTHGIFSAGYKELAKYFVNIYCTNSIKDINDATVSADDITRGNLTEVTPTGFIKQLNIFNNLK